MIGKLLLAFCFSALTFGCGEKKPEVLEISGLSEAEKLVLNKMVLAADSLTSKAANIAASDSLLRIMDPLIKKTGRSKFAYQGHRQQIVNLFFSKKKKEAQLLSDSLNLQLAQPEDTISGYYNSLAGWICWQSGNYSAGIAPSERAAMIFEKYGLEKNLNVIYNTLGVTYAQLGDHEKAIYNFEAALRLNEKKVDSVKISRNHKNLAFAHFNLGDFSMAEKHNRLGKAFELIDNGSFELQAAEIAQYQGKSLIALGMLRQLRKSRPELFDAGKSDNAMHNLLSFGEILLEAGQTDEAIPSLKASLVLQPSDPSLPNWMRAKNCCLLGTAYLKKDNPILALPFFQMAVCESVPSFKPASDLENPLADSLPMEFWTIEALRGKTTAFDLISMQKQRKHLKKEAVIYIHAALESAEYAIQIIQRLKNNFVEDGSRLRLGEHTFKNSYEKPLDLAIRLSELTGNKSALEKAFLFASNSKAGVLRSALSEKKQLFNSGVSAESIRQLRELRLKAAALQNRLKTAPSDSLQNALFQVKRSLDKFHQSLHLLPIEPSVDDNFSLTRIQNWLPDSALLVEYFLGEQNLYVFSVSKTGFEVEKKPLPIGFNALADGFNRSVSDWQWVADSALFAEKIYLQSAAQLYNFLLKSALDKNPKTTRLFVVPDQKLARLPFAALLTHSFSGGWKDVDLPILIKQMAVSYRFSSAIYAGNEARDKPEPRYGFGGFGTDYRDGFTFSAFQNSDDPVAQNLLLGLRGGPDTLDFADDEVDSIAQLTGGQKWLNGQATKSNFLENAEDCRILHISLHTVETDPHDPTGLAILFSKMSETDASMLTSSELYALDLNTELAVVSSCQSGFGQFKQGEGTLSLGRAMALAGCRSTVVNLWKADDRASRDLMISFYKNLKSGQTKDRALQNALLYYLQNTISARAGPQFWANFSAVGEMDAIEFEPEKTSNWKWWLGGLALLGVVILIFCIFRTQSKQKD